MKGVNEIDERGAISCRPVGGVSIIPAVCSSRQLLDYLS